MIHWVAHDMAKTPALACLSGVASLDRPCYGPRDTGLRGPATVCRVMRVSRHEAGKCQAASRMLFMRRFSVATAAILILIVAACAGGGFVIFRVRALEAQSQAFVQTTVAAIVSTWSTRSLLDHATPEFRNKLRFSNRSAFAEFGTRLGPSQQYLGAKGKVDLLSAAGFRKPVTASYAAEERFRDGLATFEFTLLMADGQWMIDDFRLDATAFGQPGQGLFAPIGPGNL